MDILTVRNLTKVFGTKKPFTAVNNISFSLKEGEILGLLGPNGAGKTTTIQMLLGVLKITSGKISYFGKNFITYREEILEDVNFSSTYTNLPWNLTVWENLHYTSYLYDIPHRKEKLKELIKIFRLEELLNQETSSLSAGQLTRMNLAKAFINDPKVLLLDEPTASLDPEVAKYIRDFILQQQTEKRMSIIFTSHNMPEVEEVCDRVLFINHGKIVADDTPKNLAKTLDTCHISIVVDSSMQEILVNYCKKMNLTVKKDGREYIIDVKEKQIPEFLQDLTSKKIAFTEISIDKPSLEDYFLYASTLEKKTI